jgi:uncharacterized protein YbaR (Trm112 family)
MALGQQLLEILACPKCKGNVSLVEGGAALLCQRCRLQYPIRDGIPVMMVEEAIDLRRSSRAPEGLSVKLGRVGFRVVEGPDIDMTFQLERGSCRAIGRGESVSDKTSVFKVDIALALDEGTKGLILRYIDKQFRKVSGEEGAGANRLGTFRRASDVILTDLGLSRLHAMLFADEAGVGVLDLVSKNGTFVNGQEVESKFLAPGDMIEIGETRIVLEG